MTYAVKYMVDGIVPQRKEFFTFREAHEFFNRIGNRARYLLSVDYAGNETQIAKKQLAKPFNPYTVKDIMSIPCMTRINGEKCIKVCGDWAYVQHCDGMTTYHCDNGKKVWHLYDQQICTNY